MSHKKQRKTRPVTTTPPKAKLSWLATGLVVTAALIYLVHGDWAKAFASAKDVEKLKFEHVVTVLDVVRYAVPLAVGVAAIALLVWYSNASGIAKFFIATSIFVVATLLANLISPSLGGVSMSEAWSYAHADARGLLPALFIVYAFKYGFAKFASAVFVGLYLAFAFVVVDDLQRQPAAKK